MLGSKHNTDMENKSVTYLKIVTKLQPAIPPYHTTGHAGQTIVLSVCAHCHCQEGINDTVIGHIIVQQYSSIS